MTKEKVMAAVEKMPLDFNLDELIEKLIIIEKIDQGLKEIDEGKGIPHSEVKKRIDEWKK
jgi:predicted transcriptional regulator